MKRKGKLSPKQQAFVREYLLDLNATQAAIRAGYSPKTARAQGQRLLTNVDIAEAIAEAKAKRAKKVELTAAEVIRRLDRESRRRGRDSSHSARVQALKLLGMHLGMFPKKLQLTGADGGPVLFSAQELSDDELARIIQAESEGGSGGAAPPADGPAPA